MGAGRLDGYFELTLRPWDVAAGTLICREAGVTVSDFDGTEHPLQWESVLAGVPGLHGELGRLIAEVGP